MQWLKVFGLVKISRLKKQYQFKFESLWYCHETTVFDLGTDIETITNKAKECTEIPRWPRNGQKVKMEASSSSWLWESWKQHKEANLVRTQTGQNWAESFPLQFRKLQTSAPPVLLSSCSGSQSSHKSSPVLGLTAVYVLTGDFHSAPPLWWLGECQYHLHRGTSSFGCPWSCTMRSKVWQVLSNITAKKVPDKIRKKNEGYFTLF